MPLICFFGNKPCGGTFIEMGAVDGIFLSNTYSLEVDLDWSGLLIEASPKEFAKLNARIDRNNSIKINGVVGDFETPVTWIDIEGYSQALSCIKELSSPEHLIRIERELKQFPNQIRSDITVSMKPLKSWLYEYNIKHVNFFFFGC